MTSIYISQLLYIRLLLWHARLRKLPCLYIRRICKKNKEELRKMDSFNNTMSERNKIMDESM